MIYDEIMKTQQAFTLIELMVTLAVVAILVMVALPNTQSMLLNNQIISKTNDLISAINYARTVAIEEPNRDIVIEPLDSSWTSKGWQITENIGGTEEILKIFEYSDSILVKKTAGKCNASDSTSICYKAKGRIQHRYQFLICHPNYPQGARIVRIEKIGRASTESCALGEGSCPSSCS